MTARRSFGNVRKRASGRWQATYWHEGASHQGPGTFGTKGEGQSWLSTVETDILRGFWIDPRASRQTLKAYADTWLASRADLRPTTAGKYEYLLRRHILPALGNKSLSSLSQTIVRTWYNKLSQQYEAVGDDAYRLLRTILGAAVNDRQLPSNPCRIKGAGTVRSKERPTASVSEVAEAMSKTPAPYRLPLALAAFCQLRRGEVIGLQRKHIDVGQMTVQIEQSVVVPHKGVETLGPPKSEAGRRTLAIPPNLKQVLIDHLAVHVEAEPEAWMFTNETGSRLPTHKLNRVWVKVRVDIGRPDLHLHDLRHSGLTWVAASGASLAELMRRGGHSTPSAAMVYQHATEDRDKALAAALGDLAKTADAALAARRDISTNAHEAPTEQMAN